MIAALLPKFAKLPIAQRRLWPQLRPTVALGLVLYGGTAISLHLGHRRSVDFDYFSDRRLDKPELRAAFAFLRDAHTLQDAPDTLVARVPGVWLKSRDAVKVSFFGGMRFGRVGDPLLSADGVSEIASLDDLMAHKLKVILQRGEKKDYEDIAAMIRAGVDVARGLAAARSFFGRAFQPAESLKAMVYYKDGDLPRLSRRDRNTLLRAASAVTTLPPIETRAARLSIPI